MTLTLHVNLPKLNPTTSEPSPTIANGKMPALTLPEDAGVDVGEGDPTQSVTTHSASTSLGSLQVVHLSS